jgi:hypothetical protein
MRYRSMVVRVWSSPCEGALLLLELELLHRWRGCAGVCVSEGGFTSGVSKAGA